MEKIIFYKIYCKISFKIYKNNIYNSNIFKNKNNNINNERN